MAWTSSDAQKSLVKALVSRLLQKPESAPREPNDFAIKAIQELGFDEGDKPKIARFITRIIPDEHRYGGVEVSRPVVTFTLPKTACPKIFYSGENLIVNLQDYVDNHGNVIEKVKLLEGQEPATKADWKAYFATFTGKNAKKQKVGVVQECLDCYFSHHNRWDLCGGGYNDRTLQLLEDLGCAMFPWIDKNGDEHEDFLGVRNHPDLDKKFLSGEKTGKMLHDDKNLALMKRERNAPTSGEAPSMKSGATYTDARKRRAIVTALSQGWAPPLNDEYLHRRYLEKAQVPGGRVTERGVWDCDLCGRDCMDGAIEIRGVLVGNCIEEHEHGTGKPRENVLDHFCNAKVRPTTDRVKDHLTKDQMRGLGAV